MKKLYAIVRADLPPGAQVAQTGHALLLFASEFAELTQEWMDASNNLVCLQVPDEKALTELIGRLPGEVTYVTFREPDFGDEITAAVLDSDGAKYVSSLPLTLRSACEEGGHDDDPREANRSTDGS